MPPQFETGENHHSACWLNHEFAPKVENPTQIAKKLQKEEVQMREQ